MLDKQITKNQSPVIFLMGPTACGKSNIAMEISNVLPTEIVSVDSAQVYRDMNIGTAKPDISTLESIPHHLIDLINPDQRYSAAKFRMDALKKIQEITIRRKIPLLVGGTMLYFRVLQQGISILPPANNEIRKMIESNARKIGWPALHSMLAKLDPSTATRIKPTDSQRIQRALEVCYLTNEPMSKIQKENITAGFPYQISKIALFPSDRSVLHKHIALRFRNMLKKGIIEELRQIRQRYPVTPKSPAMRCVGYRQAWFYLDNKINQEQLEEQAIAATRQLAKRQLTWLRSMQLNESNMFDCQSGNLTNQILTSIKSLSI